LLSSQKQQNNPKKGEGQMKWYFKLCGILGIFLAGIGIGITIATSKMYPACLPFLSGLACLLFYAIAFLDKNQSKSATLYKKDIRPLYK
jgi:hypothetical protein